MTIEFQQYGKLPGQPSKLIRLAITDLQIVEKTPAYRIDMDQWYTPYNDKFYLVCLAGAVMVNTLKIPKNKNFGPDDTEYGDLLKALDRFRRGDIESAFLYLKLDIPESIPNNVDLPEYKYEPIEFIQEMNKLADLLEKMGY